MSLIIEDTPPINSKSYWDARFDSHDWENNQGKQQTLFFAQLAIDNMPDWLTAYIKANNLSICDFGCAMGQASKLLASTFLNSDVIGQDISKSAIDKAKKLFPELQFTSNDLLQAIEGKYDVIFSSNTLEHFYKPHDVIKKLANKSSKFLIFLLPFYDDLKSEEHFYSFTYKNIPSVIENKFSLAFYKEIDTSRLPNTHWYGKQLLIVYAVDSVINELEINKNNLLLCKSSKKTYRLALIDSILEIESERKISEFLAFPIKQQFEQALAQKQAEHQATKQQLEQALILKNYVLSSISWRITKPARFVKRSSNKIIKSTKDLVSSIYHLLKAIKKYRVFYLFQKVYKKIKTEGLRNTVKFLIYKVNDQVESGGLSDCPTKINPDGTSQEDTIYQNVENLIKAKVVKGIIVIDCAFEFDIHRNQRPIALTKTFASQGYFIFFLRYQFSKGDTSSKDYKLYMDRVYQIPRLEVDKMLQKISGHSSVIEKRFIITIPDKIMLKSYFLFKKNHFKIHYDIMDDWKEFNALGEAVWYQKHLEEFFINNADYVSAVSFPLADKFKKSRNVKLISNGTFPIDKTAEFTKNKDYFCVGYFGHLTEKWFNWDYVFNLSRDKRFKIHIIGEGLSKNTEIILKKYDNIFFHGYVQNNKLIKYIEKFDIGLIPFKEGALSNSVDPLKVYEYLQHYRPVVSTGLENISRYPYCKNAKNFDEFKRSIICFHRHLYSLDRDKVNDWLKDRYWSSLANIMMGNK